MKAVAFSLFVYGIKQQVRRLREQQEVEEMQVGMTKIRLIKQQQQTEATYMIKIEAARMATEQQLASSYSNRDSSHSEEESNVAFAYTATHDHRIWPTYSSTYSSTFFVISTYSTAFQIGQ